MPYVIKISCIYAILHPDTGKIMYIGQTKNYFSRLSHHLSKYAINKLKKNSKLYSWINKIQQLGKRPSHIILEMVPNILDLNEREEYWIDKIRPPKNIKLGGQYSRYIERKPTKYKYDLDKIKEMIENGSTVEELAATVGCTKSGMTKFMRNSNLKTKNSLNCNPDGSFISISSRQVISKDELTELYSNQLLSCTQIAKLKNCSGQAIKAWLRKYNIPRRTQSESMKIRYARGMVNGFRDHDEKGNKKHAD